MEKRILLGNENRDIFLYFLEKLVIVMTYGNACLLGFQVLGHKTLDDLGMFERRRADDCVYRTLAQGSTSKNAMSLQVDHSCPQLTMAE